MDKNQYFSILKQLHDVCRNNPAPTFTGMDAYNEIMNYLYLRHLSDNHNIPEKYNLKTLFLNYCTDKKIQEDLQNADLNKVASKSGQKKELYYEKLSDVFLPGLINSERNKTIAFQKIMGDEIKNFKLDIGRLTNIIHKDNGTESTDGGPKAQKLINKIYQERFLPTDDKGKFNINMFPYDALGEGFEKFMKEAGSSGGNWGQYFTNTQVIDWVNDKLDIKKTHKIIDPFAGSGGFILKAKKIGIKKENIFAQEVDDKIYKFLKFNSNIAELELDNIKKGDSYDYTEFIKNNEKKFDRVTTNPPYGLSIDISLNTSESEKSKFWSVLKTGKNTIKDSMGLSMMVIYGILKDGGKAGVVCERGILNNGTEGKSWQKNLRQFLLENNNISDILLLPKGIFSHTTFDTACLIMEKGTPTKKLIFHQGYFKDEDKGKGDKKMYVKENILTITLEDIINKNWSLKYDDYIEKKEDKYEGIEYKTLDEVCEFVVGKYNTQDFEKLKVDVNGIDFYCGQYLSPIGKISEYTFDSNKPYIIFTKGGGCHTSLYSGNQGYCNSYYVKNGKSAFCSVNIAFTNIKINSKYLYYILKTSKNILRSNTKFSGNLGSIKKGFMEKFKFPILSEDHQQHIVEFMDKTFGQDYKKLDQIVSKFKNYDLFKLLINENYSGFEQLLTLYEDIVWSEGHLKRFSKDYKNLLIQKCFKMVPSEEKELGELVETSGGVKFKLSKQPITTTTDIAYLRGGDLNDYYTDNFNGLYFDYNDKNFNNYLINKGDIYYTLVGTVGIVGEYLCNIKKTVISGNLCRIYNCKINKNYLINYLVLNKPKANTNAQPNISRTILNKIKIPVPSPEDQEKVIQMIESINNEDSDLNKSIKAIEQNIKYMYECVEQLIDSSNEEVNNDEEIVEDDEEIVEENQLEDEEEITEDEFKEIQVEDKTYYVKANIIYNKKKNGSIGKECGKLTKNGKVKFNDKNIVL